MGGFLYLTKSILLRQSSTLSIKDDDIQYLFREITYSTVWLYVLSDTKI